MRRFYLYREAAAPGDADGHTSPSSRLVLVGEGVLFRNGAVAVANGPYVYDSLERLFEVFRTRLLRFIDGEQPEPRAGRANEPAYQEVMAAL